MKNSISGFFGKYRFNSVLFKYFIQMFAIMTVIFSIIICSAYNIIVNMFFNDMYADNNNDLKRQKSLSEATFRDIEYIASNTIVNSYVDMFFKFGSSKLYIGDDIDREIANLIVSYKSISRYIHSIYVYSEANKEVCNEVGKFKIDSFYDTEWLKEYESGNNEVSIYPRKISGSYPHVLTMIRRNDGIGAVVINIDMEKFRRIIKNSNESGIGDFYIISNDDKIIYSYDQELFLTNAQDTLGEKYHDENILKSESKKRAKFSVISNSTDSEYYDWKYYVITEWDKFYDRYEAIVRAMVMVCVLMLILSLIISVSVASASFRPILDIIDVIDYGKVKHPNEKKDNEIKYISNKILGILNSNKMLKEELNNELEESQRYQALALQMQINPHFLNNTLSSIYYDLLETYGSDNKISKRVMILSRIIRYSCDVENIFIKMSEEIKCVEYYVRLMQLRYGNFKYECIVPENLKDTEIIRFSIQPLIENSIYHGINEMGENGAIRVEVSENDANLSVSVRDNGNGMDECKVRELYEKCRNEDIQKRSIGIKNVYRRIKLLYGNDAQMQIESDGKTYTQITLLLPKK